MADKIYFGVPGAIEEIRPPESEMGFNSNLDSVETQLVSGGRSVYRAPTNFKTFNLSWKSNSSGLRHLIDLYNGQFGPGPFYFTDPSASAENVLPPRWANCWQLANQANGWCKPIVQNAVPTTTPSPQLPRTNRVVVLTQAPAGSTAPTSGILKTRHIRIPGKSFFLSAYGSATGGAGIKVRGYNNSTQVWVDISTFTTLTGSPTEVITAANTTYTMIELDIYMPLAATLTLYGMCLGTLDHTVLQNIVATNYCRNPWSVTSGTGFASYLTGTSETGATTFIAGATDGPPVLGLSSYSRRTITVPKTAGSTGWLGTASTNRGLLSGVAGDSVSVGFWVRYTGTGTLGGRMRCSIYDAGGSALTNSDAPAVVLNSGEWTWVSSTSVAPSTFATVGWWFYQASGQNAGANSTLDATGCIISTTAQFREPFSGDTPDDSAKWYRWTGTPYNSASVQMSSKPTDYMPTGQGVGALQFANTLSGTLTSAVIDRIGLSVDLTEVQNVESRAL